MQDAIDRFEIWAKSKGLTINIGKTKAMCFTTKGEDERDPDLTLNRENIEVVNTFKYLGMNLDAPLLTWKRHIEKVKTDCE